MIGDPLQSSVTTYESAPSLRSGQLRLGSLEKREKKRNSFTPVVHDQNTSVLFCLPFLSEPMRLLFYESICICEM